VPSTISDFIRRLLAHFVTHDLVRDAAAIVDHHFAASRLPRGRPERSAVLREEDVK
jgi:hypothetical protein